VVQGAHEQGIDHEQRRRPGDPADERVVVADDRVLHRVGEEEQHDEVERVELRQFALARQAEANQQERVDDQRPNDLLAEADPGLEH